MDLEERVDRALNRAIESEDFADYRVSACARELGLLSKVINESDARAFVRARFPDLKSRRFDQHFARGWRFGCANRFEDVGVDGGSASPPPVVRVPRKRELSPKYHSADVCETMWENLSAPREAAGYLVEGRGWFFESADRIFSRQLARQIPEGSGSETFRYWYSRGNRMVVPLRDYTGAIRSFKGRFIGDGEPERKSRLPKGPVAGLLLDNCVDAEEVIVVEGEMDWLLWSSVSSPRRVLGIFSGSVREGFEDMIPKNATVYIRTDSDKAGARYARQVADCLSGRGDLVIRPKASSEFEDDEEDYVSRVATLPASKLVEENYLPQLKGFA